MIFDPEFLEALERQSARPWVGTVYRHMFADHDPLAGNIRGARWNPPDVEAIYASLNRETALAEAEYRISVQPLRPRARRTVFTLRVELQNALEIENFHELEKLGVSKRDFEGFDMSACQRIGWAVAWLGHDGLIVPSARADGQNLVIFPSGLDSKTTLEVVGEEPVPE
ncbi:MAG: RES family NAD+ phosphorylase [bacterium]